MINGLKRKAIGITAALALVLGIFTAQPAPFTYADEIDDIKNQIADMQSEIDGYDAEISTLQGDINTNSYKQSLVVQKIVAKNNMLDLINNNIYLTEQDIMQKETDIAGKEADIAAKNDEISKSEDEINQKLDEFGTMVRMDQIYMKGNMISVLMSSTDLSDLFIRYRYMANVAKQSQGLMDEIEAGIAKLENDKVELNNDISKLNVEKDSLLVSKADLERQKADMNGVLAELTNDYNEYQSLIDSTAYQKAIIDGKKAQTQQDIDEANAEIDRIIEERRRKDIDFSGAEWVWPVPGHTTISQAYGVSSSAYTYGYHTGIDISGPDSNGNFVFGATVVSSNDGVVIYAQSYDTGYSYGRYIIIDHGGGYTTVYGHLNEVWVSEGQTVARGEAIGTAGNSGYSFGAHLHFEIREYDARQNPINYFDERMYTFAPGASDPW